MEGNGISLKGLQHLARGSEKSVPRQLQVFTVALWIWIAFPAGIIMHPFHKLHQMNAQYGVRACIYIIIIIKFA
jgi:hypothetical protein